MPTDAYKNRFLSCHLYITFLVAGVLGAYLGASYLPFLNFLLFMTATMQAHSPTAGFYL